MGAPLSYPIFRAFTPEGLPAAGWLVYSFAANSSTPLATYTTATLDIANANPVVLDANGEAPIWLSDAFYKLVLHDDNDVPVWSIDFVSGATGGGPPGPPGATGPAGADGAAAGVSGWFSLTDGATITPDCNNGPKQVVTLAGNRTFAAPANPVDGFELWLLLKQDGTGSRTATWNAAYLFFGASKTLSTGASKIDMAACVYNAADAKWYCNLVKDAS